MRNLNFIAPTTHWLFKAFEQMEDQVRCFGGGRLAEPTRGVSESVAICQVLIDETYAQIAQTRDEIARLRAASAAHLV